jgi:zinc protease
VCFLKKWILAVAISAAITGCAADNVNDDFKLIAQQTSLPAGVNLVEAVTIADSNIGIPYKKYQLANGLTVILHQDTSDPLVHVDVTYHVGSARELAGRSGFAHLFEHMMFQGSQNVADEQHFKVVTEAGGTLNGTTNSDRTNYFETVPKNQLEKMLWLESDRMGFLLPALTSEKFEVQRETVKNERAQRIDNRPYGRLGERFAQALYPEGHPYSWPVIGWPDDLERATVDDVKHFFQRWYGPNNATLTIGGDFDETQTLAWINQYFGEIPSGPKVDAATKNAVTLDKTRYLSMEDKVHLPLLYVGMPTVYAGHPDEAALDLLANIIGGGQTSLLYKNLVKDGLAVQSSVSHPCQELMCQFTLYALANPANGGKLDALEAKINESIAEFEQRGVTDEDLQKVKVQFEASTIFGLQSVAGKVATLASDETFYGDPNRVAKDLARYNSVTKADVMRVFNQYIKDKPKVVMSVVPEGQSQLIAKADNFAPQSLAIAEDAVMGLVDIKPVVSSFDRTLIPAPGDAPQLTVPTLWSATLSNGIEVMGTESEETPTVELVIYLEGGHRTVPVEKAGLAKLTAAMMNESSNKRSAEELAQALEMLGSNVSVSAGESQTYVQVSSLSKNFAATLSIVEERLFQPGFVSADFERVKQQQLQSLQQAMTNPSFLASNGFSALLYGNNTAMGSSDLGTVASVSALTLDDVKAFYQQQFTAGNAQMVLVSDLAKADVIPMLNGFSHWAGNASVLSPIDKRIHAKPATIYIIDKPDAAQSVINIGKRALTYDVTGDYFKANLMNYPLGGAFNSRINLNLREDKGYTYGARTSFSGQEDSGEFIASASVRSDVTGAAISEFINEIKTYQQSGMNDTELAFLRNSITQGQALDFETPYQKAGFIRKIQRYQLDHQFTAEQTQIINSVTTTELNSLAKSLLDINTMVILVVGDKKVIEPQLAPLGYPIEVLN